MNSRKVGKINMDSVKKLDGKECKEYTLWRSMIYRCYSEKYHKRYPSYRGCEVSEYFLHYDNFRIWCHNQVGFGNPKWDLDKDILVKGNKVYSEDTCCFVPNEINKLIIKSNRSRGEYPLGVCYDKSRNTYKVRLCINGKQTHIKTCKTVDQAFLVYKLEKEKQIQIVAERWFGEIDDRVYTALMNYKVEPTD